MFPKCLLSHRGYWTNPEDKNSKNALILALKNGFGIETDLRDLNGEIVISHDPPTGDNVISFDWLAQRYHDMNSDGILALNIKSDGLNEHINSTCQKYNITSYFVFDMSVPDALHYMKNKMPVFIRDSEFESPNSFSSEFYNGVWCDNFSGNHDQIQAIKTALNMNKIPAIVSPELHGREHLPLWSQIKSEFSAKLNDLYICTDYPKEALDFFGGSGD